MPVNVSVIVPIYNAEPYLDGCILSLVRQTVPFREIILVDDGSTDKSGAVCDAWAEKESRIRVIHQPNGGLCAARNTGMAAATGEYIAFADADDSLDADALERLLERMGERRPDICCGNARVCEGDKTLLRPHFLQSFDTVISGTEYLKTELTHRTMQMAVWQYLYRRAFTEEHRLLFEPGLIHEDELFSVIAFCEAETVLPTDITFYTYYKRESSLTTKKDRTDNAASIIKICRLLETYTEKLEDRQLRRSILDHCASIYYNVFTDADLKEHPGLRLDRQYLARHSRSRKNILRLIVYCFSEKLFDRLQRKRRR